MALKSGINISRQLTDLRPKSTPLDIKPALQGFKLGSLIDKELNRDKDAEKREREANLTALEQQNEASALENEKLGLQNKQAKHLFGLQKQVGIINKGLSFPEGSAEREAYLASPEVQALTGPLNPNDMTDAEMQASKQMLIETMDPVQFLSNKQKNEVERMKDQTKQKELFIKGQETLLKQQEAAMKKGKLPEFMEKEINKNNNEWQKSTAMASRASGIADQIESHVDAGGGMVGKAEELLKKWAGGEDGLSQIKQEYIRLRAELISGMLPAGAASDADIAILMAGFPDENANPAVIANSLRAIGRISENKAKHAKFTANYLRDNKTFSGLIDAVEQGEQGEQGEQIEIAPGISSAIGRLDAEAKKRGMTREQLVKELQTLATQRAQ